MFKQLSERGQLWLRNDIPDFALFPSSNSQEMGTVHKFFQLFLICLTYLKKVLFKHCSKHQVYWLILRLGIWKFQFPQGKLNVNMKMRFTSATGRAKVMVTSRTSSALFTELDEGTSGFNGNPKTRNTLHVTSNVNSWSDRSVPELFPSSERLFLLLHHPCPVDLRQYTFFLYIHLTSSHYNLGSHSESQYERIHFRMSNLKFQRKQKTNPTGQS